MIISGEIEINQQWYKTVGITIFYNIFFSVISAVGSAVVTPIA